MNRMLTRTLRRRRSWRRRWSGPWWIRRQGAIHWRSLLSGPACSWTWTLKRTVLWWRERSYTYTSTAHHPGPTGPSQSRAHVTLGSANIDAIQCQRRLAAHVGARSSASGGSTTNESTFGLITGGQKLSALLQIGSTPRATHHHGHHWQWWWWRGESLATILQVHRRRSSVNANTSHGTLTKTALSSTTSSSASTAASSASSHGLLLGSLRLGILGVDLAQNQEQVGINDRFLIGRRRRSSSTGL